MEQMEACVQALMSPDNTIRSQAEEAFNQAKQQPEQLVPALAGLLGGSQNEQVRQPPAPGQPTSASSRARAGSC